MRLSRLQHFALAAARAFAACDCGYTVSATDSEYSATFTELIESDFLHENALSPSDLWVPQEYNVTPESSRGPYGKASRVDNVITNPIPNQWDWTGNGQHGGDPGLQLRVEHGPVAAVGNSSQLMVAMAEIVSSRDDILYGTFRIGMKTTNVSGTCGAFFFYLNDTDEIDMEFLSNRRDTVNLVIQSPQSAEVGYVEPGSADFDNRTLLFDPAGGYHEYRFDWMPGRVDFYVDGRILSTIRDNVPNAAGAVHVSHWSNGNEGWSGGPPGEDALLTISYVKAYFNSSSAGVGETSVAKCGEESEACQIPDQNVPPDPNGVNGNETGKTFFFGNATTISGQGEPKNGTQGTGTSSVGAHLTRGTLLWAVPGVLLSLLFGF